MGFNEQRYTRTGVYAGAEAERGVRLVSDAEAGDGAAQLERHGGDVAGVARAVAQWQPADDHVRVAHRLHLHSRQDKNGQFWEPGVRLRGDRRLDTAAAQEPLPRDATIAPAFYSPALVRDGGASSAESIVRPVVTVA